MSDDKKGESAAQRQLRVDLKEFRGKIEGYDGKFTELNDKLDDLFNKLSKRLDEFTIPNLSDEITDSIEKVRDHVSKKLAYENQKLAYRVNLLEKRILDIERDFILHNQHGRKFNFQIDGIPKEIAHKDLEKTVVNILNTTLSGKKFESKNIEACHRISKNSDTTIVRLDSRKEVDRILGQAKLFPKTKTAEINGLKGTTKLFVNHNLNPHLNNLAFNCRLLKRDNLITDTWSAHGKVKVKLSDGTINIISHEIDLYRLFPEFDNFTFNTDFLDYADSEDHYPEYDYGLSTDSSDDEDEVHNRSRRRSKKFVKVKI